MKKGSMLDVPVIIGLLAGGIITVVLVAHILSSFSAAWPFADESATILTKGISGIHAFDYMILFYAVGLGMFSILSAFRIKTHPGFFIFSMILLGITVMFSAVVTNAVNKFITTPTFSTVANSFPYSVTLMRNFPLFSLVIGLVIAVVMYGKPVGGGRE